MVFLSLFSSLLSCRLSLLTDDDIPELESVHNCKIRLFLSTRKTYMSKSLDEIN